MGKKSKRVNSHGYKDGDVVWIADVDAVLRYNKADDAWYSAGPESWSCHNEWFDSAVLMVPWRASYGR